jgi:hypothetical protein
MIRGNSQNIEGTNRLRHNQKQRHSKNNQQKNKTLKLLKKMRSQLKKKNNFGSAVAVMLG